MTWCDQPRWWPRHETQSDQQCTASLWITAEWSHLAWSSYKHKEKMWRRIIERDSGQAAKTFLDSLTVK